MALPPQLPPPIWGERDGNRLQPWGITEWRLQRRTFEKFKEDHNDLPITDKTIALPGVRSHFALIFERGGYLMRLYNFGVGSPHLALGMKDILGDVATWLRSAPERAVWVIGYAEVSEGTTEQNKSLSLHRAQAVWRQLAAFKVPKTQLVDVHGGVMAGGDVQSQTAKADTTTVYVPGHYRMVDVELQTNNVASIVREIAGS